MFENLKLHSNKILIFTKIRITKPKIKNPELGAKTRVQGLPIAIRFFKLAFGVAVAS